MIKQRYVLKCGKYERCCDDESMSQEHCPEKQQKLVHDKLNKLELILKEGYKSNKCVCKFLKVLGLIILALAAVALFIRLGVVDTGRSPHHRRHYRDQRNRHGLEEDEFQKFQQNNPDIKDVTEQDASEPINKGTLSGDQVFDMFDEMYQQKMSENPKLEGYHLFYVNCTTSNKNKTDYSWDQHCQLKDYNHPDWNKKDDDNFMISSSSESEQPDEDFLQSEEDDQVAEGRRLEEVEETLENERSRNVRCRGRDCHRRWRIAYIIDGHCFILSRPQRHHRHHRRHHGHPGFCPFVALVRTIRLLTLIWILVFIGAVIKCKCCKKRTRRLFRKLVKIENRDGCDCYMMLHRGIREIEFHIKTNHTEPVQRMMTHQQAPSMSNQEQPNYYRVDLRQDRIQDDSMVSRHNESYRV